MPPRRSRTSLFGLAVRVALSVGFLAAALWLSPELPSWRDISGLRPSGAVLGVVLSIAVIALLAWRWRRIAAASAGGSVPPLGSFFGFTWACLAVNQLLPSVIGGDALRITLLTRAGQRAATAAASVITDRIYGVAGLLLICFATAPFLGTALYLSLAQRSAIAVAGLLVFLLVAWLALTRGLVPENLARIVRGSLALHDAPVLLAAAAVAHLFNIAIFLAIAFALGVSLPILPTAAVLSAVFLAGVLPISIAGWGMREFALVSVLGPLGGEHDKIMMVSIVYGFFLLLTQAMGFFMLLRSRQP